MALGPELVGAVVVVKSPVSLAPTQTFEGVGEEEVARGQASYS